jgi:hypothetical protein
LIVDGRQWRWLAPSLLFTLASMPFARLVSPHGLVLVFL